MKPTGILIIAMGGHLRIQEARANLRAIRRIWPQAPITIMTSTPAHFIGDQFDHWAQCGGIRGPWEPVVGPGPELLELTNQGPITSAQTWAEGDRGPISPGADYGRTEVVWVQDFGGFKNQTHYVFKTPYERTLHLDCDAIPIHRDAFQPFHLLGRYDFVAAHAAARGFRPQYPGIPVPFVQWNCGVMFYSRSMLPILRWWDDHYVLHTNPQGPLCRLIYLDGLDGPRPWRGESEGRGVNTPAHDPVQVYTLAAEWNYRGGHPQVQWPLHIRILHTHAAQSFILPDGTLNRDAFLRWFHHTNITRLKAEGRVKC